MGMRAYLDIRHRRDQKMGKHQVGMCHIELRTYQSGHAHRHKMTWREIQCLLFASWDTTYHDGGKNYGSTAARVCSGDESAHHETEEVFSCCYGTPGFWNRSSRVAMSAAIERYEVESPQLLVSKLN